MLNKIFHSLLFTYLKIIITILLLLLSLLAIHISGLILQNNFNFQLFLLKKKIIIFNFFLIIFPFLIIIYPLYINRSFFLKKIFIPLNYLIHILGYTLFVGLFTISLLFLSQEKNKSPINYQKIVPTLKTIPTKKSTINKTFSLKFFNLIAKTPKNSDLKKANKLHLTYPIIYSRNISKIILKKINLLIKKIPLYLQNSTIILISVLLILSFYLSVILLIKGKIYQDIVFQKIFTFVCAIILTTIAYTIILKG